MHDANGENVVCTKEVIDQFHDTCQFDQGGKPVLICDVIDMPWNALVNVTKLLKEEYKLPYLCYISQAMKVNTKTSSDDVDAY